EGGGREVAVVVRQPEPTFGHDLRPEDEAVVRVAGPPDGATGQAVVIVLDEDRLVAAPERRRSVVERRRRNRIRRGRSRELEGARKLGVRLQIVRGHELVADLHVSRDVLEVPGDLTACERSTVRDAPG